MATKQELEERAAKLQAELNAVNNEIKSAELEEFEEDKKQILAKWDKLRENKDYILSLFTHNRTSCSDEHVTNGWYTDYDHDNKLIYRCPKCALMEILNEEISPDCYTDVIIDVHFSIDFDSIEKPKINK